MRKDNEVLNGFVDSGCTIRGELEFNHSFRLDGKVEGSVRSRSEFLIGEDGVVEGEIHVARCVIGGAVRGTVRATEQVVLHSTAKVWADIFAPALVMEEGAFLEGKVDMASANDPSGHGSPGRSSLTPQDGSVSVSRPAKPAGNDHARRGV